MKQILVVLILAAAGVPALAQTGKAQKAAPKAKAAAPAAVTVPRDAEKIGEGLWRAKDPQGKVWIYKRTPFGLIRYVEERAEQPVSAGQAGVRVREAGPDRVVFERNTPFGSRTWTKAPAELDEEERQALEEWRKSAKK